MKNYLIYLRDNPHVWGLITVLVLFLIVPLSTLSQGGDDALILIIWLGSVLIVLVIASVIDSNKKAKLRDKLGNNGEKDAS